MIRKLCLGKMADTEAKLETNFTSPAPIYNKLLANSFIFIVLHEERNGYKSSFKFLLPNVVAII